MVCDVFRDTPYRLSCALLCLQVGKLTSVMELFVQGCAVVNQNLILNGDNGFEEIFGLQIVELHALCSSDADFDMARAAVECIQRTKEPKKLLLQCRSPSAAGKFSFLPAL